MRTQSSWGALGSNNRNNHGNAHAAAIKSEIAYAGQPLTARETGSVGNAATTWTVVALPETINPGDLAKLMFVGGNSSGEAAPVGFYFDNTQPIAEGNELAFDGYWYKLGKIYPTPFQGISILNYAVGVRTDPLP